MQNFTDLLLSEPLQRAISELGFVTPSPIQAQTLPILLEGPTDFLGLAATGTGKTAAFAIPLLERLDASQRGVQALILCPTRELAMQVATQIDLIGKYKGIRALPIYGGAGYGDQIRGLKRGVSVVVGTPGRVLDHLEKGTLVLDGLQTLILDEADEMISMGFKEDIETVLESIPTGQANTWLFSATMSPQVRQVADQYLNEPRQVQVNRTEMLPDTVEQIYYITQESNKPEVLCKLIDAAEDFYGIVFCQTKALVVDLHQYLMGRGYRTDCLHGDMGQDARERTMKAFRDRKVQVLIATDVACRGLDVKDISHVINYSIPRELDNYVHRIGRTGRSGKSGLALSLVTNSHRVLIGRIERMTKSRMKEGKIPTRKEIGLKKIAKSLSTFEAQQTFSRAVELMDESWKKSIAEMSKEEIAARFLTLIHPEIFAEREVAETTRAKPKVLPIGKDGVPMMPVAQSAPVVVPARENEERRAPRPNRKPRLDADNHFLPRPRNAEARPFGGGGESSEKKRSPWSGGRKSEERKPRFERPRREEDQPARGFGRKTEKRVWGAPAPKAKPFAKSGDRPLSRSMWR